MLLISEQCKSSKKPLKKKSDDEDYVKAVSNIDYSSIILHVSRTHAKHILLRNLEVKRALWTLRCIMEGKR